MSIRRNRRLHHRHHRHRIDQILHSTPFASPYRQHALLFLLPFPRFPGFSDLQPRAVLAVHPIRRSPRARASHQRAAAAFVVEPEHQLPTLIERIIIVLDLTLLDQLPIKVAALVPHASGDLSRKNTPLFWNSKNTPYLVVHALLFDQLQKQRLVLLAPLPRRLRFSGVVEAIIVLIWIRFAVPKRLDPRLAPPQAT